ncbi:MAG: homoserine dehydrogenase, partial [Clostridia bacterium]|nr:homoserine dehydrogenase [Clostridia bacterium]
MMATCYRELMETAAEHGVVIRFTPSAGGGIPWLSSLRRTARGGAIRKIEGILNGTTNFILDKMAHENADFAEVLAEAQVLGYAEKDPTSDIDGLDVRYQVALSCNVATDLT